MFRESAKIAAVGKVDLDQASRRAHLIMQRRKSAVGDASVFNSRRALFVPCRNFHHRECAKKTENMHGVHMARVQQPQRAICRPTGWERRISGCPLNRLSSNERALECRPALWALHFLRGVCRPSWKGCDFWLLSETTSMSGFPNFFRWINYIINN